MPEPALQVDNLIKTYGNIPVVNKLSLTAERGQITAILGPNGAGKTTTIECCEGLTIPDSGTLRILGLHPRHDRRQLHQRVGVMLQDSGLPRGAPAGIVLRHISRLYDTPRPLGPLLERLGIASFARTPVRRLSGGQRQLLGLATALAGNPDVVFLDEPTAGLDPHLRHEVWKLIQELRSDGVGVIVTTHFMDEAEHLADYIYICDHGEVIASGTVPELVASDHQHLTIRATAGLDTSRLASALGPQWTLQAQEDTYNIHGPLTPEVLHSIADWLASHQATPQSMTTNRRTLEDVFLDLTGRSLQ